MGSDTSLKPAAFLKEWQVDGQRRWRVDGDETCEPWLRDLKPTITPLYPRTPLQGMTDEVVERHLERLGEQVCIYGDESGPEWCGECHGCIAHESARIIIAQRAAIKAIEEARK